MPITHRSNNRILPANSRAVDVAKQAIRDIAPIQQRKYANAIEVGGHESVVYTKLTSGMSCSCNAHRTAVGTLLDAEGKMSQGTINQMLTGGLEFRVNRYGSGPQVRPDKRVERGAVRPEDSIDEFDAPQTEPVLPGARRLVDASYRSIDLDDDAATEIVDRDSQSVNGMVRTQTLDDVVGEFDADEMISDSSCLVCYGTGYVGGYAVLGGWRETLSTQWQAKDVTGLIEANRNPHAFFATEVEFTVTLPKGFVYLDTFRVMHNEKQVSPDAILIDDLPFSVELFAALCDGLPHRITVQFDEATLWTHLEIQVCNTRHATMIEFPKLQQSSDLSKLDPTDDITIFASALVPHLGRYSVIVESVMGKSFMVNGASHWNDSLRNLHGWECNARVIQPGELVAQLPRRRKMAQRTTNMTRNNVSGPRKT